MEKVYSLDIQQWRHGRNTYQRGHRDDAVGGVGEFLGHASVFFLGVQVDENVVEVHQYTNIEQVAEDVIHEALESSGCVGESKRHYMPFEGAVASPESRFPFITLLDSDQMVGMCKISYILLLVDIYAVHIYLCFI